MPNIDLLTARPDTAERAVFRPRTALLFCTLLLALPATGCLLSGVPDRPEGMPLCQGDQDFDGYSPDQTECWDEASHSVVSPGYAYDCNDLDANVNQGNPEHEDGVDNNCNGIVDENTHAYDDDLDGVSENQGDCADDDSSMYPGADDIPADGIDSDCDGSDVEFVQETPAPEDGTDAATAAALYFQDDGEPGYLAWAAPVGDLDGDGVEDMAWSSGAPDDGGKVFVAYNPEEGPAGISAFSDIAQWQISGIGQPDMNGIRFVHADLNCDQAQDLIIGDHLQRRVSVFYGGTRRTGVTDASQADVTFRPVYDGAYPIGYGIASPGDLDGDGCDELLIGQPDYNMGAGRAQLFYGRTTFSTIVAVEDADASFVSTYVFDYAGSMVYPVGDLNGDSFADMAILTPNLLTDVEQDGEVSTLIGRLSVYFGGETRLDGTQLLADAPLNLLPHTANAYLFWGLTLASGDLDHDGARDLVVGLPAQVGYQTDGTLAYTGKAHVLYGPFSETSGDVQMHHLPTTVLSGRNQLDIFAESLTVGDFTGDGHDDVAVACTVNTASVPETNNLTPGYVAVFEGEAERNPERIAAESEGTVIDGSYGSLEQVFPLSSADFSRDGLSDLLVGAQYFLYSMPRSALYVWNGGELP